MSCLNPTAVQSTAGISSCDTSCSQSLTSVVSAPAACVSNHIRLFASCSTRAEYMHAVRHFGREYISEVIFKLDYMSVGC